MARFFVDELPTEGTEYRLSGENADHAKVLRLRPGEAVTLCDGKGLDCTCTVAEGGVLTVGPSRPCPAEPGAKVSVFIAFPKADKAEHVIQKAVELGAAELVLFPSRYCVSRPDGKSLGKKLERWQKIARSAAEQSGRGVIPPVRALDSYAEALKEAAGADAPILFYENEEQLSLRAALAELNVGTSTMPATPWHVAPSEAFRDVPRQPTGLSVLRTHPRTSDACPYTQNRLVSVSLMTGSEGGFSEEEIALARRTGLKICTLGPRILRCETAPLAGLSAVMYALGEL